MILFAVSSCGGASEDPPANTVPDAAADSTLPDSGAPETLPPVEAGNDAVSEEAGLEDVAPDAPPVEPPAVIVGSNLSLNAQLELVSVAYDPDGLQTPVLLQTRKDRELIDHFLARFPERTPRGVDGDAQARDVAWKAAVQSGRVVVAGGAQDRTVAAGALIAAGLGRPLLIDPDSSLDLSGLDCVAVGAAPACKTSEVVAADDLSSFLASQYQSRGIAPDYVLVASAADPLSPAAAYLTGFRHAIPFLAAPGASPESTAADVTSRLIAIGLNPRYLALVGSHDYLPSAVVHAPEGDYYHDYPYAQLDLDRTPDVLYGRVVTHDVQDALTLLNRVLFYDRLKVSPARVDIHYCDSSSGPGCAAENPKEMCALETLLESKGFDVRVRANSDMNMTTFAESFSDASVIVKHNHGNPWVTTLSDANFSAADMPLMPQGPIYATNSCNTANYPAAGADSYMLGFFRRGGVSYSGASSLGQQGGNHLAFLVNGTEASHLQYLGLPGTLGPGYDYHGDPAFNPNLSQPEPAGVEATLTGNGVHTFDLDVTAPAQHARFLCQTAMLAQGFDYRVSGLNGEYVYGVHVLRIPLPAGENVIRSAELASIQFDDPSALSVDCVDPPKDQIDKYFCTEIADSRSLYVHLGGMSWRIEVFSCQVDHDVFEGKSYLLCHLGTPYAPLATDKSSISPVVSYRIAVATDHSDIACELAGGYCPVAADPCDPSSHEASDAMGCAGQRCCLQN